MISASDTGGKNALGYGVPGSGLVLNLVYNPQGLCVARYDKIHLFRFDSGVESYDEARVLMDFLIARCSPVVQPEAVAV